MSDNGFVRVLIHQEDRGEAAVIKALQNMKVMYFDRVQDCFIVQECRVSAEALRREIDKELGRR